MILWAVVASEPELAAFATAPVEFKNLPDDMELASEPVGTVALELSGPSGELRGLNDGAVRPAVILDMSGVRPGDQSFPITSGNVKLARGVRLVRAIPSEIRYQFERRAVKTVPVTPRFTGRGRTGTWWRSGPSGRRPCRSWGRPATWRGFMKSSRTRWMYRTWWAPPNFVSMRTWTIPMRGCRAPRRWRFR